jgi:hypothetical protein
MPRTNPSHHPIARNWRQVRYDSGIPFQQWECLLADLLLENPKVTQWPAGGELLGCLILKALPPLLDRRMVKPLSVFGWGSVGRIRIRQTNPLDFLLA